MLLSVIGPHFIVCATDFKSSINGLLPATLLKPPDKESNRRLGKTLSKVA